MDGLSDRKYALRAFAPALTLLFLAVLINYVDRGNLSIAAPLLKDEWHLSPWRLGVLFSAFFWTYTAMQFICGWLVDRFDVNRVMALGYLVWSLATAATGVAPGFALLLVMRLLLGIGESVVFPASSKILAIALPEQSRGFANGALAAAMRCGAVVGTFGGGLLMARYGWRPAFVGIGLVSLAWLPAWRRWRPRSVDQAAAVVQPVPDVAEILSQRSFWGASAGHFCSNYLLYFMVTWLPFYLVHERGLSMQAMSRTAALYYLTDAGAALLTGWVADICIRKGAEATVVRKAAMALGFTITAGSLVAWAVASPQNYLACLLATGVGAGTASSGAFAFGQTLAGAQCAGRWTGLQNGIANLSGVVGPALTGYLVDKTGHFRVALLVAAAVSIAGVVAWVFGVARLEELQWTSAPMAPVERAS